MRYKKFATYVSRKAAVIINGSTSVTYNFVPLKNVVQKGRETDFLFQRRLTLDRITLLNSYKIAASTHKPNISIIECGKDDKISFNASVIFSRKTRSEEHTSELQSRFDLVCRLLLEKKN